LMRADNLNKHLSYKKLYQILLFMTFIVIVVVILDLIFFGRLYKNGTPTPNFILTVARLCKFLLLTVMILVASLFLLQGNEKFVLRFTRLAMLVIVLDGIIFFVFLIYYRNLEDWGYFSKSLSILYWLLTGLMPFVPLIATVIKNNKRI